MIYYVVNFDFELQTSLKFCLLKFRICVFYSLVLKKVDVRNQMRLNFAFELLVVSTIALTKQLCLQLLGLIYLNFGDTLSKQNLNVKIEQVCVARIIPQKARKPSYVFGVEFAGLI